MNWCVLYYMTSVFLCRPWCVEPVCRSLDWQSILNVAKLSDNANKANHNSFTKGDTNEEYLFSFVFSRFTVVLLTGCVWVWPCHYGCWNYSLSVCSLQCSTVLLLVYLYGGCVCYTYSFEKCLKCIWNIFIVCMCMCVHVSREWKSEWIWEGGGHDNGRESYLMGRQAGPREAERGTVKMEQPEVGAQRVAKKDVIETLGTSCTPHFACRLFNSFMRVCVCVCVWWFLIVFGNFSSTSVVDNLVVCVCVDLLIYKLCYAWVLILGSFNLPLPCVCVSLCVGASTGDICLIW